MRLVFGLVLVLGLGLASFAVLMARDYIAGTEAQIAAQQVQAVETVPTYVAVRPLGYGERIAPEDVRLVAMPRDVLPAGAFSTEAELFPRGADFPRSILRAMETNEAILASKVTGPGEDAGVSARLSEGMRAFAVSVDVSSGVSGFLRPGDRVDIYWSGSLAGNGSDQNVTKLIEASVRLVAIDQSADEDAPGAVVARTVTVEATPRQVAALAQAQSTGRLSLSLVGAEDTTTTAPLQVSQRDLLGIEESVQPEAPRQEVCTVRTRRGSEVVEIPIPCTN